MEKELTDARRGSSRSARRHGVTVRSGCGAGGGRRESRTEQTATQDGKKEVEKHLHCEEWMRCFVSDLRLWDAVI